MRRIVCLCLISYVLFILFVFIGFIEGSHDNVVSHSTSRPRRYLTFMNKSTFYVRLNFKANMVPWNQLFAQAVGFRLNFHEPPENQYPHRHLLHRRSLYKNLETVMDKNGLSGLHCLRKAICEIGSIDNPKAIYHKILKIIFRKGSNGTDRWGDVSVHDCRLSTSECPVSLMDLSLYTDL